MSPGAPPPKPRTQKWLDDSATRIEAVREQFWAELNPAPTDWIPKRLYELPAARVRNIVWQHLEGWTLPQIEERALHMAQKVHGDRALWGDEYPAAPAAVLGTDGRYHLTTEAGVLCGEATPRGRIKHKREYAVHHHEGRYKARLQFSLPRECPLCRGWVEDVESCDADHHHEQIRVERTWTFRLTDEVVDPYSVHTWRRCPDHRWPTYISPKSARGKVVRQLVDTHGFDCHLCGCKPGVFLDHDHLTNEARGMLCIECNGRIEICTHLRGCAIADYLNHPPAQGMGLRYPKYKKSASDLRKEALIGMSMFTLPQDVRDWQWHPG